MSSHPSVTTYMINGPPTGSTGGFSQDSGGRSSPVPLQRPSSKLARIASSDQSTSYQANSVTRYPMPNAQSQPSRPRGYSNDRPPPQQRSTIDNYRSSAPPGRIVDRALPPMPNAGLWSIVDELPQPADDQTIISLVRQVFFLAENYVDNHYGDRHGQTMGIDSRFKDMDFPYLDNGREPEAVLSQTAHPTIAIKHCILYLLLSCIEFNDSGPFTSLLPREFTVTATALSRSSNQQDSPVQFAALSAHRVLLSYLRKDIYQDAEYEKHLDRAMGKIANAIETTFAPWREAHSTEPSRKAALTALMEKTAQLVSGELEIEVCPRLLKINDEQARDLDPSQLMLKVKALRTSYYFKDTSRQDRFAKTGLTDSNMIYSDDFIQYHNKDPGIIQSNHTNGQSMIVNYQQPAAKGFDELRRPVELPEDTVPQLPMPARQHSFSMDSEQLQTSSVQMDEAMPSNRPHSYERSADLDNNGTPRSPTRNGATHDVYSQQKDQRRKVTTCPPSALQQQFPANPSPTHNPTKKRSSRRHRSSSASSESRGRSEDKNLSVPQRRASISNDRTALIDHAHRVPSDVAVLQSPISPGGPRSSFALGSSNTGVIYPMNQTADTSGAANTGLYRTDTGELQHMSTRPPSGSSPSRDSLGDKSGDGKKSSKLRQKFKFFSRK